MPTAVVYCEQTGDAGEPLVLVHGSLTGHRTWDWIVPALARSFCVLTYHRRGHSLSARPAGQGGEQHVLNTISGSPFYQVAQPWMKDYVYQAEFKVLYKKVWLDK